MNVIKPHPDAELGAVLQPVEQARGLPNRYYTDAATFEREKHAVFARNWAGIGFGADLPEPGWAAPVQFLGQPLVMVRDRSDRMRVFQNVCRHRGMILVERAGPIRGAIRCPYHSWCYDLDGALKATPHVGGPGHNSHDAIDRDALGLIEVRSHIWRDVVFVNLDGRAEPFETAHAALLARWADFDHPPASSGADSLFTLDVATNWKLAVENYCESYHLPWVHPGLNAYSRLEDHYNIEQPGAFSGQGTHVYRQLTGDKGETFRDAPDLPGKWDMAAEYIALYPNVLLGVHRDHSFAIMLEPLGPDRTIERIALSYHHADDAGPARADLRRKNMAQWKAVFEEDVFVVEGMQRGRNAAGFDGGRFSPVMDSPTLVFHQWIARQFVDAGG